MSDNMKTIKNVRFWGYDNIDPAAVNQAIKFGTSPVLAGPIAIMPDSHVGMGVPIGAVIATRKAVMPTAVGVDLGCGVGAIKTDLTSADLGDNLNNLLGLMDDAIPAGVGKEKNDNLRAGKWMHKNPLKTTVADDRLVKKAYSQLGTLGSGNHFVEVCLDENDTVWILIHSGSRGVGNLLAQAHIKKTRELAKQLNVTVGDLDLAYLSEGTPEFDAYISDMLWAQEYAYENRIIMAENFMKALKTLIPHVRVLDRIENHHNFCVSEIWGGYDVWVTRKGAVRAGIGDRGVIPGSMGTGSYIVEGLGNSDSYDSCSHGAGRVMSRTKARKNLTVESFETAMEGRVWQKGASETLLDEHPAAYKDIAQVMEDQKDLVRVTHNLTAVMNYKGA